MPPVPVLYLIAQLGAGGTESQLLHLIRRLDRNRWGPELVTFTKGGALRSDFESVCPVRTIRKSRLTEPLALLTLARHLSGRRPGILHTLLFPANWRGALAGRLAGVPVIVGSVRNVSTWMGPASRALERMATRLADAVIVNAEAVGRFMREEVGVRADRLRLIPNGVDVGVFRPEQARRQPLRRQLWGGDAAVVTGAVMSLTEKKNPLLMVEAAASVASRRPDARFLIAGDGPLRSGLEERIRALGLQGRFLLLGVRRDVPDLLGSLDLLVLTSDREGCPNVVLEAMASSLPVVATSVGGTPDLVEEGISGLLVPPGDAPALAGAILEVLQDPERRLSMGRAGLRRAREGFGVESMVERTTRLYESLRRGSLRSGAREGEAAAGAGEAR